MERKLRNALRRAGNLLSTLLLVVVLLLAVALAGVRLFGLTPFAVIIVSMEPELPVGCLVYVKKCRPGKSRWAIPFPLCSTSS